MRDTAKQTAELDTYEALDGFQLSVSQLDTLHARRADKMECHRRKVRPGSLKLYKVTAGAEAILSGSWVPNCVSTVSMATTLMVKDVQALSDQVNRSRKIAGKRKRAAQSIQEPEW